MENEKRKFSFFEKNSFFLAISFTVLTVYLAYKLIFVVTPTESHFYSLGFLLLGSLFYLKRTHSILTGKTLLKAIKTKMKRK